MNELVSQNYAGLPFPKKQGLYDPFFEHQGCGAGFMEPILCMIEH